MKLSHLSVIREAEYTALKHVSLDGLILDVGGGGASEYQELIKGNHTFYAINIAPEAKPDKIVDIEKTFPLESDIYDHAICMNVLEHVFEFENVKLKFSDDALEAIAQLAMERKVGARGLRMILEDLMLDLMYYLPSYKKVREFLVTKEMVMTQKINMALLEKAG